MPIHKWLFCPTSALREKFYPQNINYIPPVKFFARLDLDQNPSFLDGHYLPGNLTRKNFHGDRNQWLLERGMVDLLPNRRLAQYSGTEMIRRFLHDKIVSLKKTQPEIDTLISIYAHTRPLDHIKPGVILSLGDIIATIADTSRLKVNILPHLHVTFGLPSPELVFEKFIWNDMRHPGLVDLLNPQGAIDWPWLALDPQKTKRLCPD